MKHFVFGKTNALSIQFIRYLFVGGSAAVVDLALFFLLQKQMEMHYLLAAFVAYMAGLTWNHILSVLWIFESKHKRGKEVAMVFFIALGGLLWTELLLWLAVDMFDYAPIPAKIVVLWIVLIWNFGMRKVFVFD